MKTSAKHFGLAAGL